MAATFVPETVEGAELQDEVGVGISRVRTGIVKDIDVTSDPDPLVLEKALAVCPWSLGSHYPAPLQFLYLRRRIVRPLSHNCARVYAYYETPQFAPSEYLLRDNTVMSMQQTQFLPGTRRQIWVGFTSPDGDKSKDIPKDALTIGAMMPLRTLTVAGTVYGARSVQQQNTTPGSPFGTDTQTLNTQLMSLPGSGPAPSQRGLLRRVNDAPFMGLPIGYWLMSQWSSETRDYSGIYTISATMISKVDEDWSTFGALRSKQTGRYAIVGDDVTDAMAAKPYAYGIFGAGDSQDDFTKGVVKVGPYKRASYKNAFGFNTA